MGILFLYQEVWTLYQECVAAEVSLLSFFNLMGGKNSTQY